MRYKGFLVSVATALSALLSNTSQAVTAGSNSPSESSERPGPASATNLSTDPIVQRLTYPIGTEEHLLLMRKPVSGMIYAAHGSHGSHRSHASHSSHRSGY